MLRHNVSGQKLSPRFWVSRSAQLRSKKMAHAGPFSRLNPSPAALPRASHPRRLDEPYSACISYSDFYKIPSAAHRFPTPTTHSRHARKTGIIRVAKPHLGDCRHGFPTDSEWTVQHRRCTRGHAPVVGDPRRSETERDEVRLRDRPVRRMHRAPEW